MTRKEFISNSNFPELTAKVLKQLPYTWKELTSNVEDYCNADAGVSGFIYYSETVPFAKRNMALIIPLLNATEEACGRLQKPNDYQGYMNWLAWFALESTMLELAGQLESIS